jgi:uncharacterized membrane protein
MPAWAVQLVLQLAPIIIQQISAIITVLVTHDSPDQQHADVMAQLVVARESLEKARTLVSA